MADLTPKEKSCLEHLLGMSSGYVLNFSDSTFATFFADTVGIDIDDAKYRQGNSGSKAKRMREFWRLEPNHVVGKVIAELIEHIRNNGLEVDQARLEAARAIERRHSTGIPVAEVESLKAISPEKSFEAVAAAVRQAIDGRDPQGGLDRLHTFTVKFLRTLCERHELQVDRDDPLHSLMGRYIKTLKTKVLLKSRMGELILKSSISTLESFNDVRNEQSFAHDNPLLDYEEALLVFNHVTNVIRFVNAIETEAAKTDCEVPF